MKTLFGQEITDELFDFLLEEQSNGKEIKIINGNIVAVDRVLSEEQLKLNRIEELKELLAGYDYIGIKIATGRGTREEYATQIAQMTEWANEVDRLQEEVKNSLTSNQ